MPITKDFYDYAIHCSDVALKRNAARANFYREVLREIPLRNDPKSRALLEEIAYWIEFEEVRRPTLIQRRERAIADQQAAPEK